MVRFCGKRMTFFILTLLFLSTAPGIATAQDQLTIEIDPMKHPVVEITATNGAMVDIGANVTLVAPGLAKAVARFNLSLEADIQVEMWPEEVEFVGSMTLVVHMAFHVPPAAEADRIEFNLSAVLTASDMTTSNHRIGYFKIASYFATRVTVEPLWGSNNPQVYSIKIENNGNSGNCYSFLILDQDRHLMDGLTFRFNSEWVYVSPDSFNMVQLKVSYDYTAQVGKHDFVLIVRSHSEFGPMDNYYDDKQSNWKGTLSIQVTFEEGGGLSIPLMIIIAIIAVNITIPVFVFIRRRRARGVRAPPRVR